MGDQQGLEIVSYAQQGAELSEPFTMIDLAEIDDLVLSVFLCQGAMPFHQHIDQDELFLVHSGTISLESDWGTVILRPGDLAVVPKGLRHRSSALLRSHVLLLQPRLVVHRRNGHRRLFALKDERRLEKISIPAVGHQIASPFRQVVIAHLDTFALNLILTQGTGPWWCTDRHSSLVLCYEGPMTVDSELGQASLQSGELVIVPKGTGYRLSSAERALVLAVERHPQPSLSLPL
jgi:mannose-6-phosphate isomerase-like protein (cupin superfamily)